MTPVLYSTKTSSLMSWGRGAVSGRSRVVHCHQLPEGKKQLLESGPRFGTGHPDLSNLSSLRVWPLSSRSGSIRDDTQDTMGEENPGFNQLQGPQLRDPKPWVAHRAFERIWTELTRLSKRRCLCLPREPQFLVLCKVPVLHMWNPRGLKVGLG